jgi:hypothetical protein
VAKKSAGSRTKKTARKRKTGGPAAGGGGRGDASRLDLKPLQKHIRKRIKDLETAEAAPGAAGERSSDDTIRRLKETLATLEDICFPSMTVPI